jgi:hypothetical protein
LDQSCRPLICNIHRALARFSGECRSTLAHLMAYVGTLFRFARKNRYLRGPPVSRRRPQGHPSLAAQGETLPARRAAISCILDRLVQLTGGNDPKLGELFTHAELKRGGRATAAPSAAAADWVTGAENPLLRGGI